MQRRLCTPCPRLAVDISSPRQPNQKASGLATRREAWCGQGVCRGLVLLREPAAKSPAPSEGNKSVACSLYSATEGGGNVFMGAQCECSSVISHVQQITIYSRPSMHRSCVYGYGIPTRAVSYRSLAENVCAKTRVIQIDHFRQLRSRACRSYKSGICDICPRNNYIVKRGSDISNVSAFSYVSLNTARTEHRPASWFRVPARQFTPVVMVW